MSRRWKLRIVGYALFAAALAGGWYGVMWWADRVANPPGEPNVVYASTPQDAVDKMLEMARVTKDDVLYDLGCGDARFLTTAAKRYGCRGVGWELQPHVVQIARQKVAEAGVGDLVTVHEGNIFDSRVDIREATVVALFLLPELNEKLIPKFKTLRPGARIVSYLFHTPGVKPKELVVHWMPNTKRDCQLFLWETPLQFE